MGSKNRIAKEILPFIYSAIKEINASAYVEPFVGGANMIDKVDVSIPKIANDYQYYLVEMWKSLQNGWNPPEFITADKYKAIRDNKLMYPAYLVGFVGFCCSYSGKWFGGYAGIVNTKEGVRNYYNEAVENIKKQIPNLSGIEFRNTSFIDLDIPDKSVIYCDPPYKGTTGYSNEFNHDTFWEWAEIMVELGHKVFVSEYTAPAHWKCIWEKPVKSSLSANGKSGGNKESVEKLFTLN